MVSATGARPIRSYLLADRRPLVALSLAKPYELKVPDRGLCQFTRVVLSLDEPDRFLAALGRQEAAAAAATAQPEGMGGNGNGRDAACLETNQGEALVLRGLAKRFGSVAAVKGIDLALRPGEVLALLGSNGAGKSTTIRMVTGLLRPTAGQVLVEGGAVRRLIGYVPDVPLLHESLTAREFLWLMAGLYGLSESEGRRRAAELLALVKLEQLFLSMTGDRPVEVGA